MLVQRYVIIIPSEAVHTPDLDPVSLGLSGFQGWLLRLAFDQRGRHDLWQSNKTYGTEVGRCIHRHDF